MEALVAEAVVLTILIQATIPFPELMRHPRPQQARPRTPRLLLFFQVPTPTQILLPPHHFPCAMEY